jgi:hypothetical protein
MNAPRFHCAMKKLSQGVWIWISVFYGNTGFEVANLAL